MEKKLEQVIPQHLTLLIDELAGKNITGVKLKKQGNRVILLFDKSFLSRTNQTILNTINAVYPNIVISINDPNNPFDYEELYGLDSEKVNKKIRPYTVWNYRMEKPGNTADGYFQRFGFAGIELDTSLISDKKIQFGFFLEFINAFQVQDVIGYEDLDVLDADILRYHQCYIDSRSSDTTSNIEVWVKYNEELVEVSAGLVIAGDPYLPKLCIADINAGIGEIYRVYVELAPQRIFQNFEDYMSRKSKGMNKVLKELKK